MRLKGSKTITSIVCSTLFIAACHKPLYVTKYQPTNYSITQTSLVDSNLYRFISPYKNKMDDEMKVVIGKADKILTKAQPECTLGNFMADAQLQKAKEVDSEVVGAVVNYGGIRLPYITAGPITVRNMYELMPFDNTLTIVEIPGNILKQFCDHMAASGGWPVSNISYVINDGVARDIKINSASLDEKKLYKIAVNDYLATGGDKCSFLMPLKKTTTSIFTRDIFIEYVKEKNVMGQSLHASLEKRVSYVQ